MRQTEFDQLMSDTFGRGQGKWLAQTHVLADVGSTAQDLIERGMDFKDVWLAVCKEFDIPEERRFGEDRPSV